VDQRTVTTARMTMVKSQIVLPRREAELACGLIMHQPSRGHGESCESGTSNATDPAPLQSRIARLSDPFVRSATEEEGK